MSNFKFGFSSDDDCRGVSNSILEIKHCESELEWFPAKEILSSECTSLSITNKPKLTLNVNHVSVQYISYSELDDSVIPTSERNLSIGEHDQSDLIPAKYEGGMKIWECTFDLATYLTSTEKPINLENKSVLDLGCGAGVLGLVALKLGAEVVHFQDYNEDVLREVTISNVSLNFNNGEALSCKYFSGDWASFNNLNDIRYDVILTCETIYNYKNYQKLHDTLRKKLKNNGVILLAAKTYYFGVGGGTRQFESLIEKESVFKSSVCWKCSTGVHREILQLKFNDPT